MILRALLRIDDWSSGRSFHVIRRKAAFSQSPNTKACLRWTSAEQVTPAFIENQGFAVIVDAHTAAYLNWVQRHLKRREETFHKGI
jgi:hypothetical protein